MFKNLQELKRNEIKNLLKMITFGKLKKGN